VVGAVVGEYLGSAAGLGYLIQQAEGVFDVAGVFAGMFVLSGFVILIDLGVTAVGTAAFGLEAQRGARPELAHFPTGTRCSTTHPVHIGSLSDPI